MQTLTLVLTFLSFICYGVILYLYKTTNDINDRIIKSQQKCIDGLEEALSRNRWLLASYKEENTRAWKAYEVWQSNYMVLQKLCIDNEIEIPLK